MNSDVPITAEVVDQAGQDEKALRAKAIRRSLFCAGAGFALIGRRRLGVATFGAVFGILPALIWLAIQPGQLALYVVAAFLMVAIPLSLAEHSIVKRAPLQASSPKFLVGGYVATCCVAYALGLTTLGIMVTSFGTLIMKGTGMRPTLEPGERLVYHKRVDWKSVHPGSVVVFRNGPDSAWGQPGWIVISRILAGPGDTLSIDGDAYLVNGTTALQVADVGAHEPVIGIPSTPDKVVVPADSYFIVQDSPAGGFDSRVLSWVHKGQITGSRIWYLSARGILKPLQ